MVTLLLTYWCSPLIVAEQTTTVTTHVIVNASAEIKTIDEYELMAIFSMHKQYWESGDKIQIVSLKQSHPLHQQFTQEILGIQPYQLERGWNRNIFKGTGKKPIVVDNIEELIKRVGNTRGAIGYIDSNKKIVETNIRIVK